MDERYIAALDLGTSFIKLAVAKVQGENVQIIYYKDIPSDGITNGAVRNPGQASVPVRKIIEDAENELKIKVLQVVVGLPRYFIKEADAMGCLPRTDAGTCITAEEIAMLKDCAEESNTLLDENSKAMVYGSVAQSFSVDGYCNISEDDIVGMVSDSIEGNFKFFIGDKGHRHNIDVVMNNAQVAVSQLVFTPEVVARAVLTKSQRENGVALIELGAGVSSVTVYHNGILRHYASIPFGGDAITSDIKYECGITKPLAENIKMAFGACQPEDLPSFGDKIIKINYEEDSSEKSLPVSYLSEVITCREREIVEALLFEIQKSGLADALRSGIVITGGGANLVNCANLIKEMSGYEVSFGFPRHLFSAEGCLEAKEMDAVTVVGMILKAKADTKLNCLDRMPVETDENAETEPGSEPQHDDGSLFPEEDVEKVETVKPDKGRSPKPKKPKKARTPVKWVFLDKFKDMTGGLFDDLYDGMMNNDNETEV